MKRSTKIITSVALSIGLVGGATAYGKHQFGDPAKRAAHMVNYISDELNLDTTQEQTLSALKDELINVKTLMRDQMMPLKDEVQTLISAEHFDQARALEMITTRTATINEAAPTMVAAFGNFIDSLDAQQKAEVVQFIQEKREHGRHGRDDN